MGRGGFSKLEEWIFGHQYTAVKNPDQTKFQYRDQFGEVLIWWLLGLHLLDIWAEFIIKITHFEDYCSTAEKEIPDTPGFLTTEEEIYPNLFCTKSASAPISRKNLESI